MLGNTTATPSPTNNTPHFIPNKEKYIRPIHSLTFLFTHPPMPPTHYLLLFENSPNTRLYSLFLSPSRQATPKSNRSVQRDRGKAETVWRGNFSRNICRTRRVNSSRPRIDWPPACRAELTHFRSNRASDDASSKKRAPAFFARIGKKKGRKKERKNSVLCPAA